MTIKFSEDIHSVTDLKRNTKSLLNQVRHTGRPIVLTVNGKADAVLMGVKSYVAYLSAVDLARELVSAEKDVKANRVRPVRAFLREFKHDHSVPFVK